MKKLSNFRWIDVLYWKFHISTSFVFSIFFFYFSNLDLLKLKLFSISWSYFNHHSPWNVQNPYHKFICKKADQKLNKKKSTNKNRTWLISLKHFFSSFYIWIPFDFVWFHLIWFELIRTISLPLVPHWVIWNWNWLLPIKWGICSAFSALCEFT